MQSQPWSFEEQIAWNYEQNNAKSTAYPSTDEFSEHLKCSKCKQSHCKISNCIFIDELSESPQWSKRKGLQSNISFVYQLMGCQNVCIAPNAKNSDDKSTVAHRLMSSQSVNHALNARESLRKINASITWWALRTTVILNMWMFFNGFLRLDHFDVLRAHLVSFHCDPLHSEHCRRCARS